MKLSVLSKPSFLPSPTLWQPPRMVGAWLSQLSKTLKQWLITDNEIRITPVVNRCGQTSWQVYDPLTRQVQSMASETDILRWLDTARHRTADTGNQADSRLDQRQRR